MSEDAQKTKRVRLFIALLLPDEALERLAAAVIPLKKQEAAADNIRWTPERNYHLTLAFLGSVMKAEIPAIAAAMKDAARGVSPFSLQIGPVVFFPGGKKPRLLAARIADDARLDMLQRRLVETLGAAGHELERRKFRPHITVARLKRGTAALSMTADRGPVGAFPVDRLNLYQSDTQPAGAVYSVVKSRVLG